jgi:hypothetical protein
MNEPQFLLDRLSAIGQSLSQRESALALIGLGSAGLERDRLDRFSDLDFFVIVKPGYKAQYLEDLSWLSNIAPVAYHFLNTKDGYKLLYADGVFCEFAVFEEAELETIPFTAGKIVWRADGVSESIATSRHAGNQVQEPPPIEFHIGEALTNLYVGLQREQRGEKLTATRFIQSYAVDHILALGERLYAPTNAHPDPFNRERRFEFRYPEMAPLLPDLLQGYERNHQSARAALTFLDQNFEINEAMKNAILKLCDDLL